MKYSTPNISWSTCRGNRVGSIGYCERWAAVARILWSTKSETSTHVSTRASMRSPDGSDLVSRRPVPGLVDGDGRGGREGQGRHVVGGDHVGVAGPARGDALLADELPRSEDVQHAHVTVLVLASDLDVTGQDEVHRRRGLALLDEVGPRREPLDVDEVRCVPQRRRLPGEDRHGMDEVVRALEAGGHLDDPGRESVPQQHPALRPVAVEQPDRRGGLPLVAGRGHGGADGDVVRMAGEPVRPERDHHVGIELVEQPRRELDQDLRVDVGQLAVRVVQTPASR